MNRFFSKSSVKDVLNNLSMYRYHLIHKRIAKNILKSIEQERGPVDSNFVKLSNEYAKDILGWEGYAPWLYVYSAISGNFKEGWIPDNYYGKVVVPKLKGDYGKVSDLKPLSKIILKSDVLPDIAYYVNGLFFSKGYYVLDKNKLQTELFENNDIIVYKVDNSLQGKGVLFFEKSNFDIEKVYKLGNGVFQEYIKQHSFFDRFMNNSVATIRITTVVENSGDITVRASYLRIGRTNDSHVQSDSHIRIPISIQNGELDEYGYMSDWKRTIQHPDSMTKFKGAAIPFYSKCLSTAISLHKLMPFTRSVGWDMIIDKDNNVKLMEWNGYHNDIKFSEATQGPCFSDLGWDKIKS